MGTGRLGVLGRGRAPRADGPDGLVGHHEAGHLVGGQALQRGGDLALEAGLGLARPRALPRVSPTHTMGVIAWRMTARSVAATISSVWPNKCRRSEWPTIT